MVGNYNLMVVRKRSSHQYKPDASLPDSWEPGRNDMHNQQDTIVLFDGPIEVWRSDRYQTVANIPGGRYLNTVAPGDFHIEWDVEPRQHRGRVHGIIFTKDLEGQMIDGRSIEPVPGKDGAPIDLARWLVHDTQKLITSPAGVCRCAWSAGCFIGSPEDSEALWQHGVAAGFAKGDRIPGKLIEVDW